MTKPAERSRRRCFEIAGRLVRKFAAISPTVCWPPRNSLRISRRVGSAIALNTALLRLCLTVTIRLHLSELIGYDCQETTCVTPFGGIHECEFPGQRIGNPRIGRFNPQTRRSLTPATCFE